MGEIVYPLGWQVLAWESGAADFCIRHQVRSLKVLDLHKETMDRLFGSIPGLDVVYRRPFGDQRQRELLAMGEQGGRECADEILLAIDSQRDRIKKCEGINEPYEAHRANAPWYNAFMVGCGRRLHEEGVLYLSCSWSVGQPDAFLTPNVPVPEEVFLARLRGHWMYYLDGLRESDGIALHEYGAPRMWNGQGYLCLRYRYVWRVLPPDCRKPLYITELGVDAGVLNPSPGLLGWRHFGYSEQDYREQQAWYLGEVMADVQQGIPVVALHTFQAGTLDNERWGTFSILGCEKVGDLVRTQPGIEIPEGGQVMPGDETLPPPIDPFTGEILDPMTGEPVGAGPTPEPTPEPEPPAFEFTLGFEKYARRYPAKVGDPASDLSYDDRGNAWQYSSNGLLFWHKRTGKVVWFADPL